MYSHVTYPSNALLVSSRAELETAPFDARTNLIVWPRTAQGDFDQLAATLAQEYRPGDNFKIFSADGLKNLWHKFSADERLAANVLIEDISSPNEDVSVITPSTYGSGAYEGINLFFYGVQRFHMDKLGKTLVPYNDPATEFLSIGAATRVLELPGLAEKFLAVLEKRSQARSKAYDPDKARRMLEDDMRNFYCRARKEPYVKPFSIGATHMARIAGVNDSHLTEPLVHRGPPHVRTTRLLGRLWGAS